MKGRFVYISQYLMYEILMECNRYINDPKIPQPAIENIKEATCYYNLFLIEFDK